MKGMDFIGNIKSVSTEGVDGEWLPVLEGLHADYVGTALY